VSFHYKGSGSPDAAPWRPDPSEVEAIATGQHGDPFAVLGLHRGPSGLLSVRVFRPWADEVQVVDAGSGALVARLEKLHQAGFFAGQIAGRDGRFRYRLRFTSGADSWEEADPYGFPLYLGELDLHLMAEGTHRRLYEKLGAHPAALEGVVGVAFAVWAPNARRVSVVGDFNRWDGRCHPMRKRHDAGVWELFIPGIAAGTLYKYEILGPQGELLPLKADPVAFSQEAPPSTASRVHGLVRHDWEDGEWMLNRGAAQSRSAPISIYEVHLGSWRRGKDNAHFSYERLADELVPYVTDLGFTHLELLPIGEHPFSGSWGYQPIGLFAPTARFGPPEAFARFVDRCHRAGVGVIVDWVPAHFPNDEHGLVRFDGTALYEHEDPRLGVHKDWSTLIYNFGRREVASFLEANALFWLDRYHVDGLRVDAVASMLYLDYSRQPGEWLPNAYGGRENLDAIAFLRRMNTRAYGEHPDTMTIAEESTAWPNVSRPVDIGGLGFGYKWNMGWMHDTLDYMSRDPIYRRHHHNHLTFGLLYAFHENFILPLSHDEVVHGKGSLIAKMPGDRWQKFANLRAYLAFMWTHPGKKLLFMGGEFAQEREWNHDHSLDWHLLADASHRGVQALVRDLNRLYREVTALHERDCEPEGFEWIDGGNADESVVSYLRKGSNTTHPVLVVCNFTPVVRHHFKVGAPFGGRWRERLNTDAACYGGSNVGNAGGVSAANEPWHGRPYSLELTLPPLATLIFQHQGN
jgi:1,4-alpha-glucan branching enzyme